MSEWVMPEGRTVHGSLDKLVGIADGGAGWLVFNNPERRNAVSKEMWEAIPVILKAFEDDPEVKVVILTGAGGKAFVSGADISEFETRVEKASDDGAFRKDAELAYAAIANCKLPTIAMIGGACVGGGMATALCCDLRIASEGSKFGIPAARLGIGYPYGGVEMLVAIVGPARAKQILYTASIFGTDEAAAWGVIHEAVPKGRLDARVAELAATITANAPLSVSASKASINHAAGTAADMDFGLVEAAISKATHSEDLIEGHRAFLEKRRAIFKGR
ncbi:enoyl-CoA hydratase [Henriciella sp. AS95]|uniref:enoyl-CoA hydratase n=1 Tax=Henriciella sp. AS95 TaxID=3135782 RepID=UPI0031824B49